MKIFCTTVLLFISGIALSQDFKFTGSVYNEEGEPLESATIYAEKPADSSLISYTISNKDGGFELEGSTEEARLNLFVNYSGYQLYRRELEVKNAVLDSIVLKVQDNLLEEVMVTAVRSPITVKQDTLEFNARSFDTRPNANLEELLKALPGVEVDHKGDITVNGKQVSRVLVNGEPFFGNDHKIATENLPKEIIDKVQVVNTKTESEEFTGEPGDPDNKTINITIQEDKNKGYFGRLKAAGGTNERYGLNGMINYFNEEFRVSVLGSANNINNPGFSLTPNHIIGAAGQAGITRSESAGANLAHKWEDDTKLSGDYFFGRNDTETHTRISREHILPDSRYFSDSESRGTNLNDSHRGNAQLELLFGPKTKISIAPRINFSNGISFQNRTGSSRDDDLNLINTTESSQTSESQSGDFRNRIDFTRRYGEKGSYFQMDLNLNHSKQDTDNFYYSESRFYEGAEEEIEIQDQFIDQENQNTSYAFGIKNRSFLAEKLFLSVGYDFNYSSATNKRYVYDKDGTDDFSNLNNRLSDDFEVITTRHTPNLGISYQDPELRVEANLGLLHTNLENENLLKESSFGNSFNNLSARASVNYSLTRTNTLSFRYGTNISTPSISQLQPVIDRTDPLNIVVGNPKLRPTFRQNMSLEYSSGNFGGSMHSASLGLNFTDNNIVPVVQVSEDLVRSITYTNVNGGMGGDFKLSYMNSFSIKKQHLRYSTNLNTSYNKNLGFTNGVKYMAERYSLRPGVTLWYLLGQHVQVNPRYSANFSSTRYDIDLQRNRNLVSHSLDVDTQIMWPKNLYFKNFLSFNYSGDVSPGYDNTSLMWNMMLNYDLLENKLNLGLEVYDLLNQNLDTRRIMGDDYIQDISNLILKQYFMLSLTFNLNKFGGGSPRTETIQIN